MMRCSSVSEINKEMLNIAWWDVLNIAIRIKYSFIEKVDETHLDLSC